MIEYLSKIYLPFSVKAINFFNNTMATNHWLSPIFVSTWYNFLQISTYISMQTPIWLKDNNRANEKIQGLIWIQYQKSKEELAHIISS